MIRDPTDTDTARRRFVQLLGAGAALGTATTTAAAHDEREPKGGDDADGAKDGATAAGETECGDDSGLITLESDADFETTAARVEPALERRDLLLVTSVDHADNAATVGEELPTTTLFLFGNPEVGTPLMQAGRSIAIDLPQKLLVWEADGEVFVTYNDPQYLARRHGLEGVDEQLAGVADALAGLARAVARDE